MILNRPGPTVVGSATLREVGAWFEIDGCSADRSSLSSQHRDFEPYAVLGRPLVRRRRTRTVEFRIGDVTVYGVNPCQRCVVPSRDPLTGAVTPDFQRRFAERREQNVTGMGNEVAVQSLLPAGGEHADSGVGSREGHTRWGFGEVG